MKTSMALLSILLFAAFAAAADVDGTWTGKIDMNGMEVSVVWTFKAEGAVLTGGVSQEGSPVMPLKDGKIEGKDLTFVLVVDMQGEQLSINYKGILVSPTEMKLTGEVMGQSFEYVVKKKA
ncbi:MAG TPA: hypothetical protein PLP83_00500 [Candidatus Aminicenantes bacterium]|nr:hypothetical protein [Candidatus Aminicenantes bacterium]